MKNGRSQPHEISQDLTVQEWSLPPAQTQALASLLRGETVTAAAAAANVARETVHRWLRDDPIFQAEWNRGKASWWARSGPSCGRWAPRR
jgi:hypothetical protein